MPLRDTYNTIIVSQEPRGRFREAIIDGTPKPGTVMQLKSAVDQVNGKFTYEVYNRDADGDRPKGAIWVLLENKLQGKGITDAYVSGTLGQLYCPLPGDELLMLVGDVSGTGDDHAIGDIMLEAATDPTADALMLCEFTGF
mgnify:CR=1 FL=1